jgi:hypothetical protein
MDSFAGHAYEAYQGLANDPHLVPYFLSWPDPDSGR